MRDGLREHLKQWPWYVLVALLLLAAALPDGG